MLEQIEAIRKRAEARSHVPEDALGQCERDINYLLDLLSVADKWVQQVEHVYDLWFDKNPNDGSDPFRAPAVCPGDEIVPFSPGDKVYRFVTPWKRVDNPAGE